MCVPKLLQRLLTLSVCEHDDQIDSKYFGERLMSVLPAAPASRM
jgi:hypothetical protein